MTSFTVSALVERRRDIQNRIFSAGNANVAADLERGNALCRVREQGNDGQVIPQFEFGRMEEGAGGDREGFSAGRAFENLASLDVVALIIAAVGANRFAVGVGPAQSGAPSSQGTFVELPCHGKERTCWVCLHHHAPMLQAPDTTLYNAGVARKPCRLTRYSIFPEGVSAVAALP